jgi:hypothetical protein
MARYDALKVLYAKWDKSLASYESQVADAIDKFLFGLRIFLQAPPDAVNIHNIIGGASGSERYPDPEANFRVWLERAEDGSWPFCFSVKIATSDPSLLHKFVKIYFPVRFYLTPAECRFEIIDDARLAFKCELDAESPFDSIYTYVYDSFEKLLTSNPWDRREKLPIGFELSRQS